jgi:hypothetical protein
MGSDEAFQQFLSRFFGADTQLVFTAELIPSMCSLVKM